MKPIFCTLLTVLTLAVSANAWGYSNFIAYGYKSCATCHYDPNGNGPLTDYGRGVWASHIAGKPPWGSDLSEEQLAESSHLLYKKAFPKNFRAALDYRGIMLTRWLNKPVYLGFLTMKADATVIVRSDEENRVFGVVNLGYIEDPDYSSNANTRPRRHLISRAHYVGFRPNDSWTLLAGFTDVAFGLRIPEHVAFSRFYTDLGANDQTHGVLAKVQKEAWELSVHAFAGNLLQSPNVRAKGLSTLFEYEVAPDFLLGGSALFSTNDFRRRGMASVHLRKKMGEGTSLISELGVIRNAPIADTATTGFYLFSQFQTPIVRGLLFLPTGEFYNESTSGLGFVRLGPGLQWFPFQRLELRFDLRGQWQYAPTTTFQVNGFGQLHVSL